MDIQKAKEEKRQLERAIKYAMNEFSLKTGLAVDYVEVTSFLVKGETVLNTETRESFTPTHFSHQVVIEVKL
jgi:type IV secretory pathway VirD2 relaxase